MYQKIEIKDKFIFIEDKNKNNRDFQIDKLTRNDLSGCELLVITITVDGAYAEINPQEKESEGSDGE